MPDMVIVDTDILIDSGRGVGDAVACLQQIEQRLPMAVSVITQMELIIGCRDKKELRAVDSFLSRFELIKLDENISDIADNLLRSYRLSHGLLIADALIAATAIASGHPFVTKNQRDYQFIEGLNLLPYPNLFDSNTKGE